MAYRVKLDGGIVATIENGKWKSSDSATQEILNDWLEIRMIADDPKSPLYWLDSPATPDKDLLIATEAVKVFGGVIIDDPLPRPPLVIDGKTINESDIIY